MRTAGAPFKLQNAIDHVLEDFRPCDRTFFIYVSDYENGYPAALGKFHQGIGALFYLAYTAGSRRQIRIVQRLDRIYDQDARSVCFSRPDNTVHIGLCENEHLAPDSKPLRPQLELSVRFFARYVEVIVCIADIPAQLQKER